jgi:hypothetical protein
LLTLRREKLRRLASTSLHEFVAQAWHVVKPSFEFKDNWHVGAICEHLEAVHRGQIRRLLINIPPRFLKSTVVSVMYPAWKWLHRPQHKFLCGSYNMGLAVRDNLAMRRLIQSPWFQSRWGRESFALADGSDWGDPDSFELTTDQNQKIRFENDRTGYRIAFGFGSGVMGEGGDDIIVDDPHDRESAHSDKQRETDITTFREAISTRLNNPQKSAITVVMQRLHEGDLSGYLLELGGWEHLLIPMHYDPARSRVTKIGWQDPRKAPGDLLHPDRFPQDIVKEWEDVLQPYAAAGQLEQKPAPAEGGILKKQWWRFYNEGEAPKFEQELQSWDLAFKGTATSNFVAGQAWGKAGANCYLKPDEVYRQLDFVESCAAFEEFSKAHPYPTKLVEDKANGPALISTLKNKIPGIVPVSPDGGVVAVAHAVAPYVSAGNVWLPNPYRARADRLGNVEDRSQVRPELRWVLRFIENAAMFPNGSIPAGSHGDDVAAAVQAIHHMQHWSGGDGFSVVGFYDQLTKHELAKRETKAEA